MRILGRSRVGSFICLALASMLLAVVATGFTQEVPGGTPDGPLNDDFPAWDDAGAYGDTCLGKRTECYSLAHYLYMRCVATAETTMEFFWCEDGYDGNMFDCYVEYLGCLVSPWR